MPQSRFLHTRPGFPRFSPVLDISVLHGGDLVYMTSGHRRLVPNRTILDRNYSYFSVKLINWRIFKLKYHCRRKSMQEKDSIISVRCELKISSFGITVRHHSASLVMPNSYPRDGIFKPHLTSIKDSYIPVFVFHGLVTVFAVLVLFSLAFWSPHMRQRELAALLCV